MKKFIVPAYSKINITLTVGALDQETGLHEIDTIMQTIDLHDTVHLSARRDKTCTCNLVWEEGVEDNALKAANLFVATFDTKGVDIVVEKEIPVGKGLGGSSADAAAVLKGMATMFGVDMDALVPLAASIGSDVPYLLTRGLCRVTGYGERVEILPPLPLMYALLVIPEQSVSTADAYQAYEAMAKKPNPIYVDEVMGLLMEERNSKLYQTNNLYSVCSTRCPAIANAVKALQDLRSLHISMTGSGSCVYALYNRLDYAEEKRDALIEAGYDVKLCRLID
jgi:4-diphosphocytidyl-2-C-methyl-D-erythritol kinase